MSSGSGSSSFFAAAFASTMNCGMANSTRVFVHTTSRSPLSICSDCLQGPSRGDRPQQEPIPEEAAPATGEEKGATPEGTENGSDDDDNDGDEGEWGNESERHVMYELLDGFRSQNVSADDRHARMTSAGGQFADMLSRHWTEKSTPPEWLVSLFRPTAPPTTTTPASAEEVAQVNTSSTARSSIYQLREIRAVEVAPAPT
ncbi:unnamed protein product [Ectocarpus sp. CCAP 1310/34]|nr:unnamed protein product [Ectocarpus sp. CCAP 1310/34]